MRVRLLDSSSTRLTPCSRASTRAARAKEVSSSTGTHATSSPSGGLTLSLCFGANMACFGSDLRPGESRSGRVHDGGSGAETRLIGTLMRSTISGYPLKKIQENNEAGLYF